MAAGLALGWAGCNTVSPTEDIHAESHAIQNGTVPNPIPPYVVSLNGCTATLLSPTFVLTAQHCTYVNDGTGTLLAPGRPIYTIQSNGVPSSTPASYTKAYHVHPDIDTDSALWEIDPPINLASYPPLFWGQDGDLLGKTVTTYGLGGTPDLRQGSFIFDHVVRDAEMNSSHVYDGKYFVAAHVGDDATIPGDSGGPTFYNGAIVGTTGGGDWRAYVKSFRNWVSQFISPTIRNYNYVSTRSHDIFSGFYTNTKQSYFGADVDGDGREDLVRFDRAAFSGSASGDVWVSFATARAPFYGTPVKVHDSWGVNPNRPSLADVDGDGRADLIDHVPTTGEIFVALSQGTSFGPRQSWGTIANPTKADAVLAGDVNGDGMKDLVIFKGATKEVVVKFSCGGDATTSVLFCSAGRTFADDRSLTTSLNWDWTVDQALVGDWNGDNLADLAINHAADGATEMALTSRPFCGPNGCLHSTDSCLSALHFCPGDPGLVVSAPFSVGKHGQGAMVQTGDADGDGKDDLMILHGIAGDARFGDVDVAYSGGSGFGPDQTYGNGVCASANCLGLDTLGNGAMAVASTPLNGNTSLFYQSAALNDANIGETGGTRSESGTVETLRVAGGDVFANSDQFLYSYLGAWGDGMATVKVTGLVNTDAFAKAGLMVRDGLGANATNVMVNITPVSGAGFQYRQSPGATTTTNNVSGPSIPTWLRLIRSGATFSGWTSPDQTTWTQIGPSIDLPVLAASTYVGMAASSHSATTATTATFDKFSWTPASAKVLADANIGISGGTRTESNGTETVSAAGADIFGAADQFMYSYKQLNGNGSIVAKVTGLTNTNSWAKAGLMIRSDVSAGAPNVMVAITPSQGVTFQTRTGAGATTTNNATTAGLAVPRWLKLTRVGNVVSGYYSTDGSSWVQVGTNMTLDKIPAVALVGLAVTSHNAGSKTTATFTNVTLP